MDKLLIIHSIDPTTNFLNGIPHFLVNRGYTLFSYHALTSHADADLVKNIIATAQSGTTIIFLGHGSSHSIYLPLIAPLPSPFVNSADFGLFQGKNLVSLSCRSTEFIFNNFDMESSAAMLGFDDLPTHWDDVHAEREVNFKAYQGMTDDVLDHFREILVNIFACSIADAMANKMDFREFYFRLRLYTNRHLFRVNTYSISDNPTLLANILFELKQGIKLFGNPAIPILHPNYK